MSSKLSSAWKIPSNYPSGIIIIIAIIIIIIIIIIIVIVFVIIIIVTTFVLEAFKRLEDSFRLSIRNHHNHWHHHHHHCHRLCDNYHCHHICPQSFQAPGRFLPIIHQESSSLSKLICIVKVPTIMIVKISTILIVHSSSIIL